MSFSNKLVKSFCSVKAVSIYGGIVGVQLTLGILFATLSKPVMTDIFMSFFMLTAYTFAFIVLFTTRKCQEEDMNNAPVIYRRLAWNVPDHIPNSHVNRYHEEQRKKRGFFRNFFCDPFGTNRRY